MEWKNKNYSTKEILGWEIPMVEIFETVEGEGLKAGFPTVFVRVFHCNLRCTWCDTVYSYAPAKPEFTATIEDIVQQVKRYSSRYICLTGGEPLIHQEKSAGLIEQLTMLDNIQDIHIETNGAIHLQPFAEIRSQTSLWQGKVRFIMDYKLPDSGEMDKMIVDNFQYLEEQDEIKFVIGSDKDFEIALEVMNNHYHKGVVLMSPVWETMPPRRLVEKVLEHQLSQVKVNLQLHKIIWDPNQRGV
ncbi:MAG: radical SAM protein [Cyanothece sp. SIO1E1]|nr:radical SAM protein [Cyanothece sp. SIO1E1]